MMQYKYCLAAELATNTKIINHKTKSVEITKKKVPFLLKIWNHIGIIGKGWEWEKGMEGKSVAQILDMSKYLPICAGNDYHHMFCLWQFINSRLFRRLNEK